MLPTISRRSTILLAALLLLVAPAQADSPEGSDDAEGEDTPTEPEEEQTENPEQCQLVDYSLSKPTSITPDPDRCFIPYILGHIPV